MGRRSKRRIPKRKTFAIVVDGETEVWYFNMLKRNERDLVVHIKPELPTKKTIEEQYQYVKIAAENNTKVFWIVDFDTILKETKESKKKSIRPIDEFAKYRNELEEKFDNVVVIINSPCLEFWLLLHFEKTSKYYDKCMDVQKHLTKYMKDYKKSEKFYTRKNNDIYKKLKPRLNFAIENSKSLKEFDINNPHKAMAQMHKFFLDESFNDYFKKI